MKLFVVYVGGKMPTSLIELHDIHFGVGETIEDTYDQLRQQWWGVANTLHLDAWGSLDYVDGYAIRLQDAPAPLIDKKLFFVNLGGYDFNEFTELHRNVFVVADNAIEAKKLAMAKAQVTDWKVPHKDYLFEVENCVNLQNLLQARGIYLTLEPSEEAIPFQFTCQYLPIGI